MKWILASASPRRKELLSLFGVPFSVITADVDESSTLTDPAELVCALAAKKGRAVAARLENDDALIISADTVVACDGQILGKPRDKKDARRMLSLLSGRSHEVLTGVCVIRQGTEQVACECTAVTFDEITDEEINAYIQSGEPFDKAGAYAVQGGAARFVSKIDGDYFNVVGLPVRRLYRMLKEMNISL